MFLHAFPRPSPPLAEPKALQGQLAHSTISPVSVTVPYTPSMDEQSGTLLSPLPKGLLHRPLDLWESIITPSMVCAGAASSSPGSKT